MLMHSYESMRRVRAAAFRRGPTHVGAHGQEVHGNGCGGNRRAAAWHVAQMHCNVGYSRVLSRGAGDQFYCAESIGAPSVRRAPEWYRSNDPRRGPAADEDQPRRDAEDPLRAQRTRGRRLRKRRRGSLVGHGGLCTADGNPGGGPQQGARAPVHELTLWLEHRMSKKITRVGIGGPVGSGKTAIVEAITPRLLDMGIKVLIITNDVVTTEDAKHVQRTLKGILVEERILGVETGACPHTAVREDPSMNLAAVEDMESRFPDTDLVLIESGGDNLTLTFSPALVDYFIYVIDVAAGDKIPRKNGPGITHSDLLVINKTDLAPYVGASLDVMRHDADAKRSGKPTIFTNCKTGEGIAELVDLIKKEFLFDINPRVQRSA